MGTLSGAPEGDVSSRHDCDGAGAPRPARPRRRPRRARTGCCATPCASSPTTGCARTSSSGSRTAPCPARELAQEFGELGVLGMHLEGYGCQGAKPRRSTDWSAPRSRPSTPGCARWSACRARWRCTRSTPTAARSRSSAGCPRMATRRADRLLRPDRAGLRLGPRLDAHAAPPRRRRLGAVTAPRCGSPTARSPTSRWCGRGPRTGIRGFLVEKGTPGFTAQDVHHKISLRASITSELILDDVRRARDRAMLPEARGLKGPLGCLTEARFGIIWGVTGAARDALAATLDYAGTRVQFGKPIAGFQLTQRSSPSMAVSLQQHAAHRPPPRRAQGRRPDRRRTRSASASSPTSAARWRSAARPARSSAAAASPPSTRCCGTR